MFLKRQEKEKDGKLRSYSLKQRIFNSDKEASLKMVRRNTEKELNGINSKSVFLSVYALVAGTIQRIVFRS